jgi:hypothetical protein
VVPSPETFISFVRRGVEKAEASDYSPTVAEMQLGKFPGSSVALPREVCYRCDVKLFGRELKTAATARERQAFG